jgi:FkbM family methyltransferase
MGIIGWLNERPELHALTARPELRSMATRLLRAWPLVRTLPGGTRYRFRYLDAVSLSDELFVRKVYDNGLPTRLETFCDLGCNSGFFVARLRERYPDVHLRGLAIDANGDLVAETQWLLRENGCDGVTAVHGLVGKPEDAGRDGEFFLNAVSLSSSAFAELEPNVPRKGPTRKVSVSYVDVEGVWRGIHGDRPCDLLKCDIEGGERDFLRRDNPFLARVKVIVAEVHLWIVSLEAIDEELKAAGFVRRECLDLGPTRVTVVYDRPSR